MGRNLPRSFQAEPRAALTTIAPGASLARERRVPHLVRLARPCVGSRRRARREGCHASRLRRRGVLTAPASTLAGRPRRPDASDRPASGSATPPTAEPSTARPGPIHTGAAQLLPTQPSIFCFPRFWQGVAAAEARAERPVGIDHGASGDRRTPSAPRVAHRTTAHLPGAHTWHVGAQTSAPSGMHFGPVVGHTFGQAFGHLWAARHQGLPLGRRGATGATRAQARRPRQSSRVAGGVPAALAQSTQWPHAFPGQSVCVHRRQWLRDANVSGPRRRPAGRSLSTTCRTGSSVAERGAATRPSGALGLAAGAQVRRPGPPTRRLPVGQRPLPCAGGPWGARLPPRFDWHFGPGDGLAMAHVPSG